ncbi:MAG TPA: hypothetical protein EYN66_14670 [Myxococcales bacterium]|nr:hypothetical protein [Myxococcales bacterium]
MKLFLVLMLVISCGGESTTPDPGQDTSNPPDAGTTEGDDGTPDVSQEDSDSPPEEVQDEDTGDTGTSPSNTPPTAKIQSPDDGAVVQLGDAVTFSGIVGDAEDDTTLLSVVWSSSQDGTLHEHTANPTGISSFQNKELSTGEHLITLTVTDSKQLSTAATMTLTINTLPSAPEITIEPAAPTTQDDLKVVIVNDAVDPNGDDVTYEYVWKKGNIQTDVKGVSVGADMTIKGQEWSVKVSAKDQYGSGPPAEAVVMILNSPPSCSEVTLLPKDATTTAPLSCECVGWQDSDKEDVQAESKCTFAGLATTNAAGGCTVAAPQTSKGNQITCTLTPSDGESEGSAVASNTVIILNSPPSAGQAILNSGTACDVWSCEPKDFLDADGDILTYTYRWEVEGNDVGVSTQQLQGVSLKSGQHVQCYIKATDGAVLTEEVGSKSLKVPLPANIPIVGLEAENMGVTLWNTYFGAIEGMYTGHEIPKNIVCSALSFPKLFAYYFSASRDWLDPTKEGAFHAVAGLNGFENLSDALKAGGYSESDITMQYGLADLGNDIEGQDWTINGNVETRTYSGGKWTLSLKGVVMVGGNMPDIQATILYGTPCDFEDDIVQVVTDYLTVADLSKDKSAAVQSVAAAFLKDLNGSKIRTNFEARVPAIETQFNTALRWGSYLEVTNGFIEVEACK